MKRTVIQEAIRSSFEGTSKFPEIVAKLIAEGVDSYHVDLVRSENRYYTASGDSLVESVDFEHPKAARAFSAEKVQAAIKRSQAREIGYGEFLRQILEAGTVYYIAYLSGKRVVYFGAEGDFHVEWFPGANRSVAGWTSASASDGSERSSNSRKLPK